MRLLAAFSQNQSFHGKVSAVRRCALQRMSAIGGLAIYIYYCDNIY